MAAHFLWKALHSCGSFLPIAKDIWTDIPVLQSLALPSIEFPVLDVGHFLYVACELRRINPRLPSRPWIIAFLSFIICCVGGSTAAAVIIGIPPRWLSRDVTCMWISAAFAAVMYLPGIYRMLRIPSIWIVLSIIEAVSWAFSVAFGGVELSFSVDPKAKTMAFLCGVLAGCGGGIIASMCAMDSPETTWNFREPKAFHHPTPRFVGSAIMAALYLVTREFPEFHDPMHLKYALAVLGFLCMLPILASSQNRGKSSHIKDQ